MASGVQRFGRAIVIGGSIDGLVCARVLADHFDHVTVIERDVRPEAAEPRRTTPQARHCHLILEAAARGLEGMFPGFLEEMKRAGAVCFDPGAHACLFHYGAWKPRFTTDMASIGCTRPLVEHHVRRRVEALTNVEVRYERTAEELLTTTGRTRVTGVRLSGGAGDEALFADLVVDAGGRGTRAPRWLESLGYGRPEEEAVAVDLAYTTRLYELPPGRAMDWHAMAVYSPFPSRRGAFAFEVEHHRLQLSLTGYLGDHAPTDEDGFLAFLRSLPVSEPYELVKDAKPLTDPVTHKIPSSRWFHYETMVRFPERLLILGDAVCSLNPLYGQGVTVGVRAAEALAAELAAEARGSRDLDELTRTFPRKLSAIVFQAWTVSTLMDLRFPEVQGKRPPGLGALQWAFANLVDVTNTNPRACRIFYELLHMRRGPEALAHPDLLLPLLAQAARSAFADPEAPPQAKPMPAAPRG